ncbi:hypothetical protein [Catalinimonas niigatensis]|uniref:hypothetical protein n=1 Tax=Catalinimonas niigatensis TaxID=1397264 RepID=UPI002666AB13|nr:hypothetical protein [Catalinimonas niigatensis]WPP52067.1 hypothetical protein PZB72_06700 [Catalinimonas niigatensis]
MEHEVTITDKELNYLEDLDFLLTRHKIYKKINHLLLDTEAGLKAFIFAHAIPFPENIKFKAGKIAKGENYRLLPYFILDYPRQFHRSSIFALRTMFWWGHYFSVTLHLSGKALDQFRAILIEQASTLYGQNMYLYTNMQDPWQHHLDDTNYIAIEELSEEKLRTKMQELPYIKLTSTLELGKWDQLPEFTLSFFKQMLVALSLYEESH